MGAPIGNVVHTEHDLAGQLALDSQIPLINVGVSRRGRAQEKHGGVLGESGSGKLEVRGRAHSEIQASSSAHHRLRIEPVGKAQPRPKVLAVYRDAPHAGSGEQRGSEQLLRGREIHAHRLQSRLSAAQIEIDTAVAGEIAEFDVVVALVVGRAPLIAQAEVHSELRIDFPVVLNVEARLRRFVGHRG